jgi:hypothetical protein
MAKVKSSAEVSLSLSPVPVACPSHLTCPSHLSFLPVPLASPSRLSLWPVPLAFPSCLSNIIHRQGLLLLHTHTLDTYACKLNGQWLTHSGRLSTELLKYFFKYTVSSLEKQYLGFISGMMILMFLLLCVPSSLWGDLIQSKPINTDICILPPPCNHFMLTSKCHNTAWFKCTAHCNLTG